MLPPPPPSPGPAASRVFHIHPAPKIESSYPYFLFPQSPYPRMDGSDDFSLLALDTLERFIRAKCCDIFSSGMEDLSSHIWVWGWHHINRRILFPLASKLTSSSPLLSDQGIPLPPPSLNEGFGMWRRETTNGHMQGSNAEFP